MKNKLKQIDIETLTQLIVCLVSFCILPTFLFSLLIPSLLVSFCIWFPISLFLFAIIKD